MKIVIIDRNQVFYLTGPYTFSFREVHEKFELVIETEKFKCGIPIKDCDFTKLLIVTQLKKDLLTNEGNLYFEVKTLVDSDDAEVFCNGELC